MCTGTHTNQTALSLCGLAHRPIHLLDLTMRRDFYERHQCNENANDETNSQAPVEFDPMRWAQLNPWLSEGQADDRTPMNGSGQRKRRNTIRSARFRPEVSSGNVQEVVSSETRLTDPNRECLVTSQSFE